MANIIHWDRLIHKNVRSNDMQDMGNVIAIDDQSVTMMQGRHEFKCQEVVWMTSMEVKYS